MKKLAPQRRQSQFIFELQEFIKSHSYYQENSGASYVSLHDGTIKLEIKDPNGDYEEIQIKIKMS